MTSKSPWILRAALASVAGLTLAGSAQAQQAGSWMLRGGVTKISPDVSSRDLTAPSLPGTKVDVTSDTRLSGGITYMLNGNVALDFPLALPFKQDITGDGAIAGAGKIGDVTAVPTTLFVQYRFGEPTATLRPYVGAGPTYAKLYKTHGSAVLSGLTGGSPAHPTLLSADSRWAMSFQIGAVYALNERWFIDAMVAKTLLKTRATLSTGQTIDLKINPMALQVGLGYRF